MKPARFVLSWALYWLGDVTSAILHSRQHVEWWCAFWYPAYNNIMSWSVSAQGQNIGDSWPWSERSDV